MTVRHPVPWYRSKEDYDRIRAMVTDSNRLPDRFEVWLELAQKQEAQAIAEGKTPERVIMEPELFRAFCDLTQIERNVDARKRYIIHRLKNDIAGNA